MLRWTEALQASVHAHNRPEALVAKQEALTRNRNPTLTLTLTLAPTLALSLTLIVS